MPSIRRRVVIQALGGIALGGVTANALLQSCARSGNASGLGSANPQPVPNGPLAAASAVISTSDVGTIGSQFAGLSYEKNSLALPRFTADNADLIGMFSGLGESLLRVGGNSVDQMHWTPDGAGRTGGQVAPSDIDALAGFLKETGWLCLYGVNLATSTPQAAAGEIAYAVRALGESLYGIEIGNECDLYGGHYFQTWSLQAFEALWQQFRAAILEVSPGVRIAGPASAGNIGTWTVPFGEYAGISQIALLTQHHYRGTGRLLGTESGLAKDLEPLAACAASIGLPFRITETHSSYDGGTAAALWAIEHLFTIALAGGSGANLHGDGDGTGYAPIVDNNGAVIEASPEYYGMLLFTRAGRGTLSGTSIAAEGLDVSAYTVRAADGTLNMIAVNKEANQSLKLSIDCGRPVRSAAALVLSAGAPGAAARVKIQGAAVTNDGGFEPSAPYTVPFSGTSVQCYLGALEAVCIAIA